MMLLFVAVDRLLCLKQPGTAGNADCLQCRADGEADRLVRAGRIRDEEIGPERIKPPMDTFDGSIKGFHVDGDVDIPAAGWCLSGLVMEIFAGHCCVPVRDSLASPARVSHD